MHPENRTYLGGCEVDGRSHDDAPRIGRLRLIPADSTCRVVRERGWSSLFTLLGPRAPRAGRVSARVGGRPPRPMSTPWRLAWPVFRRPDVDSTPLGTLPNTLAFLTDR